MAGKTPKVFTTDAETYFDDVVNARRAAGRKTYGTGLEHRNGKYDWNRMALEEALDCAQYLAAQNRRLEERLADLLNKVAEDAANPWQAKMKKAVKAAKAAPKTAKKAGKAVKTKTTKAVKAAPKTRKPATTPKKAASGASSTAAPAAGKRRGPKPGIAAALKPCPVTGIPNKHRRFSYLMPEARTPENLEKYRKQSKENSGGVK